jgi:uncharacterized membrane protein YfcA
VSQYGFVYLNDSGIHEITSDSMNYVRQGVVDYATAKWLLLGAIPAIVVGAVAAHAVPTTLLTLAFGVGLLALGAFLVLHDSPEKCVPGEGEGAFLEEKNAGRGETTIETADGESFTYETCWRPPGIGLATVGGFITGLISAGLPEITTTQLIVRCRLPPRVAIATSVFVLAVAALAGAAVHALAATSVWYVVAWSIPGVLIGGTVGTRVGKYVPSEIMEPVLGVVFGIVGVIVFSRVTIGTSRAASCSSDRERDRGSRRGRSIRRRSSRSREPPDSPRGRRPIRSFRRTPSR